MSHLNLNWHKSSDANPADAETPTLPLGLHFAEEPLKILKHLIPQRRKRKISLLVFLSLGQALHTREAIFTVLKMHSNNSRVRKRLLHFHSHTPGPAPWGFVSREWPFHDEWWEKRHSRERSGMGSSSFVFKHTEKMAGISLVPLDGNIPQPWRWHSLIYASHSASYGRLLPFKADNQNNAGHWL